MMQLTKDRLEKKKVKFVGWGDPSRSGFAVAYKGHINEIYTCRETFSRCFKRNISELAFLNSSDNLHHLPRFVRLFEEKMGLKVYSEFYNTNYSRVLIMSPSSWWKNNSLRRNFLTILIRAGYRYRPDKSFLKTLKSGQYFTTSKKALSKFLDGYTKCSKHVGGYYGWSYWFSDRRNNLRFLTKR